MNNVNISVLPDGRMSRADAAKFLGFRTKSLAEWQRLGRGPRSLKVGGRVFYYLDDLIAFRDNKTR